MSNIEKQFKGNLGMFLVCAELSKHNLIAMPTSRNTKGHDIVVLNPETNIGMAIQVKCTGQPKSGFPIASSHWKDCESIFEKKIISDFVFVDISEIEKPKYFIVPRKEVKQILKASADKYIQKTLLKHGKTLQQMEQEAADQNKKPNLWAMSLSDIEIYEDRWENITDKLLIGKPKEHS